MDPNTHDRSRGNMHAKGCQGKRKRIYNGKKKKRKYEVKLREGGVVLYECGGKIFRGVVHSKSKEHNNSYVVHPDHNIQERCDIVSWQGHPTMMEELTISDGDLSPGNTILITWQLHESGFLELIPAQVVQHEHGICWVKPNQKYTNSCVRVTTEEICKTFYKTQIMHQDVSQIEVAKEVSSGLSTTQLVLNITEQHYAQLIATHQETLEKLKTTQLSEQELKVKTMQLNDLLANAIETISELEADLNAAINKDQVDNTLYKIISEQKDQLDFTSQQLLSSNAKLASLREAYQTKKQMWKQQKEGLTATNADLHEQVQHLTMTNEKLQKDNATMKERLSQVLIDREKCLQKRPNLVPGADLSVRVSNQKTQSFLKLNVVKVSSSCADEKTLKKRADRLSEVLNVLSSSEEKPNTADVIATLAGYLKRYPHIGIPACQAAKLTFQRELSAKEIVDLKVLLKLPMCRMKDLRRFLSNHNIRLMPSDTHLYKEMSARQSLSPEVVEIGIMRLPKVVNGDECDVAFARVKDLETFVLQHVTNQFEKGNVQDHPVFDNEVWVKIGGDKGGTSTKLAMQLVNQNNPNSPDSTNIISMYEATDSRHNLDKVFNLYFDQFIRLQQRIVFIENQRKILRIFLFGDYEFLCKILGHMGASASYPCLWCNITLTELRKKDATPHCPMKLTDGKWVPNANWARPRTIEQMEEDLKEVKEGNYTNVCSINKEPILKVITDMQHVIPPSLHILLGLVVRFFKLLELECRKQDHDSLGERDTYLYDNWQEKSEYTQDAEVGMKEATSHVSEEEALLKGFKRAKAGRNVEGLTTEPCCMPICALQVSTPEDVNPNSVQWIQCTQCGSGQSKGWYHEYCVGLSQVELDDGFVCPVCTGVISSPDDVIEIQQERIASAKAKEKEAKNRYKELKKELDKIFEEVAATRGPIEKQLNHVLEHELGVKRQAYHSQCFVGDHCKKILKHKEKLLDVLPDGNVKNKFYGLFGRLNKIFKYFGARFLSQQEVKELSVLCWELGMWFPTNFPEELIPPKLHFLVCHIPECASRWKTIGLLSEHGLESIHANINAIERTYCTVRDKKECMRLVLGNHQQRVATDRTSIQVPLQKKRVCVKNCGGRYKQIKNTKSKKCQNEKCGHVLSY